MATDIENMKDIEYIDEELDDIDENNFFLSPKIYEDLKKASNF